jgi:uncharacterized repeat protein (TIGR02543 family)
MEVTGCYEGDRPQEKERLRKDSKGMTIESRVTGRAMAIALLLFLGFAGIAGLSGPKAHAEENPSDYTVIFDPQGGEVTPDAKTVATGEKYGELPTPTHPGYSFLGWYTEAGGSGTEITPNTDVQLETDCTLYACWEPNSYTVTFDALDGNEDKYSKSILFSWPYEDLAPAPVRTGYLFGGWWTELGGAGTEVTPNTQTTIPADHTLYDNWIPYTYTINFDIQGGTLLSESDWKTVTYGETYGALPEVERETYLFGGWWTEPGGAGTEVTSTTQVTILDTQTLYANWTRPRVTVTFDSRGGSEEGTFLYTYGKSYGILGIPNYPGYTFINWFTEPEGGIPINAYTIVSIPNDHTLYARWTPNTYRINFDGQGGGGIPATLNRQFDAPYGPCQRRRIKITLLRLVYRPPEGTAFSLPTIYSYQLLTTTGSCQMDRQHLYRHLGPAIGEVTPATLSRTMMHPRRTANADALQT